MPGCLKWSSFLWVLKLPSVLRVLKYPSAFRVPWMFKCPVIFFKIRFVYPNIWSDILDTQNAMYENVFYAYEERKNGIENSRNFRIRVLIWKAFEIGYTYLIFVKIEFWFLCEYLYKELQTDINDLDTNI